MPYLDHLAGSINAVDPGRTNTHDFITRREIWMKGLCLVMTASAAKRAYRLILLFGDDRRA
jgi:hypothetical protein